MSEQIAFRHANRTEVVDIRPITVCISPKHDRKSLTASNKILKKKYVSTVKPTRYTIFEFIEYHSTCFGRSFRPSSGVQDRTQHHVYVIQVKLTAC